MNAGRSGRFLFAPVAAAVLLTAGCAGRHVVLETPACAPQDLEACRALYAAAVRRTMHPRPEDVRADLSPIVAPEPPGLWDDEGRVLVVTYTRRKYFADPNDPVKEKYTRGETFQLHGDTWFTIVPQLRILCTRALHSGALDVDLRIRQVLGLPPDNDYDALVQVWVRPEDLFRPCPDPSTADRECQLDVPVVGGERPASGPPWAFCADPERAQVSERFESVDPAHLKWMCDNWCETYCGAPGYPCSCTEPEASPGYPWTALGYTYDWGRPESPEGTSEVVAPAGTEVVFEDLWATIEYCMPPPSH